MSDGITISECTVHGQPRLRVNISRKVARKQVRKYFPIDGRAGALSWASSFVERVQRRGTDSLERAESTTTVSQAITRFRDNQNATGEHARLTGFYLEKFKEAFGTVAIKDISPLDLVDFWSRKWKPYPKRPPAVWGANTKRQAFAYLRVFFNWCERYDIIDKNPARRVDPPKGEKPPRHILTPAQMAVLLRETENDAGLRCWLCLGGLAGLRTSEIISGKLSVNRKEVHVEDGKTGGRYVTALPAFARWWPGKFTQMDERTFRRHREALIARTSKETGLESWPDNALRHSFASYHLGMWEDAGKTAFQLGHTSPQMVYKAYARAVKKADARKWWALALNKKKKAPPGIYILRA